MRLVAYAIRWAILAVAVWIAAELIDGIQLEGWESTLIIALILGLLNVFLKPILAIVALPLTLLTFGLFLIVINTGLLALTAWIAGKFDEIKFDIEDFGAALLGAIVISVVGFVLNQLIDADKLARDLTRPI